MSVELFVPSTATNLPTWIARVAAAINYLLRQDNVAGDPRIAHAEAVVKAAYGDTVSVADKKKDLNKFGRKASVGTNWTTLQEFAGSEINETFVTTNTIDKASSASTSDTGLAITIEGQTIDGSGNLTFTSQDVTLNGQTQVTLATPLARITRCFVKPSGTFGSPQTEPVGNVYFYSGTATAGVPTTASACHMILLAGDSQSQKAATAISQFDYWFISYFSCAVGDATGPTDFATVRMETRDVKNGGVWRPLGRDYTLWPDVVGIERDFDPFIIVPKNHDWRVRGKCNGGTATIYAETGGYLAAIV